MVEGGRTTLAGAAALALALATVGCDDSGATEAAPDADATQDVAADVAREVGGPDVDDADTILAQDADVTDAGDATADADASEPAPDPPPGPGWHRRGAFIVDAQGRTIVLHGVNASNDAKWDEERLPWQGPEDFQDLADAGFDNVRLLTFWAAIMPEEGVVDDDYLDAYAQRVQWAADAGLTIIVDMHQDIYGYGFGGNGAPAWSCDQEHYDAYESTSPWWMNYTNEHVRACFDHLVDDDATFQHFADAWVAMADRVGDHPDVVGFDLMNEPNWGSYDVLEFVPQIWQPRMEQLSAAIREVAPDRLVFFQAPPLFAAGAAAEFEPAADAGTALTPHYYHPTVHEGDDYVPAHDNDIDRALDAIDETAANLGDVPVWMGEFGAYPGNPTTPAYTETLVGEMASRLWGWAWWSDDTGGGFSLRDSDGEFVEAVLEPLSHPYARRVPGPLLEQAMDFDAGRYELTFTWTRDAPLELWAGRPDTAAVALGPVDGDGEVVCSQAAGAPDGVRTCPVPDDLRWGGDYRLVIEP
ncbi:MAG: glycoside hydrolase family 5 protein [Myxococcota bacterium]